MWVAPEHRGHGVADALLRAAFRRAQREGASTVTLWVSETNARALAVYRRAGFVLTDDTRPRGTAPRGLELRMRRDLTPVTRT